jgi:hypothetical protein
MPPFLTARAAVIDKSAIAIARSANPPQFEGKLRESQRNDPKFSFLNPTDPYHAYYRDRMVKIESGEVEQETAASGVASKPEPEEIQVETTSDETMLVPPPSEYILDLPAPSPLDLCVAIICVFAPIDIPTEISLNSQLSSRLDGGALSWLLFQQRKVAISSSISFVPRTLCSHTSTNSLTSTRIS